MQAESAPNSDSTIRYSHGASSPEATRSESPSTMWVCGEIGYAATTCGRHRATVSATAREPTSCLSMGLTPPRPSHDEMTSVLGQPDVRVDDPLARPGEPTADRTGDGFWPQQVRDPRDSAYQRGVGERAS